MKIKLNAKSVTVAEVKECRELIESALEIISVMHSYNTSNNALGIAAKHLYLALDELETGE